tara:strand:+ start:849 stop:1043 length:195 start_codon:yes stop_codon:yes gene_type:complete
MRKPKGKRIMSKKKKTKVSFTFRDLTNEEVLREYGASFTSIGRPFYVFPPVNEKPSKGRRRKNG